MSKETMNIGAVPGEEACEQVGMPSYNIDKARFECQVYRRQLQRMFGEPPEGAAFAIVTERHEFGGYYEVAVKYDPDIEDAHEFAYEVERESPANWDDVAKDELIAYDFTSIWEGIATQLDDLGLTSERIEALKPICLQIYKAGQIGS